MTARVPGNTTTRYDAATNRWVLSCADCDWTTDGTGLPKERVVNAAIREHHRDKHEGEP